MRDLVINVSAPHYNLGARKLADYLKEQGSAVAYHDGDPGLFAGQPDRVWISVVFSWHAEQAAAIAWRHQDHAEIHAGGPGLFALAKWWKDRTGGEIWRGLDPRFDRQRGKYKMTFASRGCPVNCYFCIVPRLEGTEFTFDPDFDPAPILCDNNLSALPAEYQDHIIRRYTETGTILKDANSGFEPITFTEETYNRWRPILRGPWRFAFDTLSEAPQVHRMMQILSGESATRKQVYVLIGNEPIAACHERAQKVIEWGGQPYVRPLMPLNALSRDHLKIAHDWTHQKLKDFQRHYNRHLWRYFPLSEYSNRKNEPPPFADFRPTFSIQL